VLILFTFYWKISDLQNDVLFWKEHSIQLEGKLLFLANWLDLTHNLTGSQRLLHQNWSTTKGFPHDRIAQMEHEIKTLQHSLSANQILLDFISQNVQMTRQFASSLNASANGYSYFWWITILLLAGIGGYYFTVVK